MQIWALVKKNPTIFFLYIASTFYFIFHNYSVPLWDFSAYSLNAKYLFYSGSYFEIFRAPLVPILLGIFFIVGEAGKYLYIFTVSTFFLYTSLKISGEIFNYLEEDKRKVAKNLFYFFSLTPFVLIYGLSGGTELLGLAFLELFFYSLIKYEVSGHWLALATLTRYNFLYFIPFIFINKKTKEIAKNFLIFLAVIFPWMLFNYIKYGNWFTSFINSYFLNIELRQGLIEKISFFQFSNLIGWFWPLALIGLLISIFQIIRKPINENKISILMFLIIIVVLYDFLNIPFKIERYLFNIVLPLAFFSSQGTLFLIKKMRIKAKNISFLIIIIFLVASFSLFLNLQENKIQKQKFSNAAKDIVSLNISHCEIISPNWVIVAYYTQNVYPLKGIDKSYLEKEILNGKIILIFKNESLEDYPFNFSSLINFPILYETDDYIFLAKKNSSGECNPKYVYDSSLISNPCEVFYRKLGNSLIGNLSLNFCKLINKK